MSRLALEPGASATISRVVGESDLASTLSHDPIDAFPAVFATAWMIAMMEMAAARALRPLHGPGELSVGVLVDVTHTAPTAPGATVEATATFLRMDGSTFLFEVVVTDGAGDVGRGLHGRVIVSTERLEARAARRAGR